MRQLLHFAGFLLLGTGLFEGTAFASVTDPNCGGLNQRACTLFDAEFWSNNSAFCDFGLKSNKGVLTALSGGAAGTCINDNRQTVPKDNSWTGWALSEQRYNIQKDLPINFVTHLGTHNSFSNYADKDNNWLSHESAALDHGPAQLRGARHPPGPALLFRRNAAVPLGIERQRISVGEEGSGILHLAGDWAVHTDRHPAGAAPDRNPPAAVADPDHHRRLPGQHSGAGSIKGTIAINNRLYANGIREVADWLNDNPGEFIVLMGDDYSQGHDDLINTPIQTSWAARSWAKADQSNYVAGGGQGWPTMADLQLRTSR